ncbi:DUF2252 domain-containing protein [Labilithrix luteola]|uniref:DUF2252 domain-containing protein n=1 Tax=Labilithrix luteola TaxID=1391654 RepID=UPI001F0A6AE4|nr:DUF2252 domain-containing protein [Labilithrix luteola]
MARHAKGRALRERFPLSSHAVWRTPSNRPNPLDLLEQSHETRLDELEALRWGRMGLSPFTFLRGSAMVMAWDVAHLPHGDVYVQACGDAHLGNFGTFATPERRLIFDLRDFDETLPAPWEWDVKRLAASIIVSARDQGISDSRASDAVLACMRQYRETMQESVELSYQEIWYRRVDAEELKTGKSKSSRRFGKRWVKKARKRTSLREMEKLTQIVDGHRHIKEDHPVIFPIEHGHMHDVIAGILVKYAATLSRDRRVLFDRYRLVDLAYRVVGVGSVGTRCMIALFTGDNDDDPLFLQMKEANRSVLEPFAHHCVYSNQGERVVQGQRIIQAASDLFLGWKRSGRHDYYVRQLKDMKGTIDFERLTPAVLAGFAALCGRTLAQAHARSGDFCQIAGYLGESDQFDNAILEFALSYTEQVERDHEAMLKAARGGLMPMAAQLH